MKLETKLTDWLTVATNIGVIMGLVFLALEYRQNNDLLLVESNANRSSQVNALLELIIQDPTLIELMEKDTAELDSLESERLLMLGIRTFVSLEAQYNATANGHGFDETYLRSFHGAIYHRDTLNYGLPYAWPMFKARGETDFTRWFEANIVSQK